MKTGMRVVGIILVVIGALALGMQAVAPESNPSTESETSVGEKTTWVSPVVGGIMVVSGLLLLATDLRRD